MTFLRNIINNLTNPQHGWKTTHFWGPVANWGLVLAAVYDASFKEADTINLNMTAIMCGYSSLFIRFAWKVKPRNYLLFACHSFNVLAQTNQLRRAINYRNDRIRNSKSEQEIMKFKSELNSLYSRIGMGALLISGSFVASWPLHKFLTSSVFPKAINNFFGHPAGMLTIFFWAPTSKWALSANNIVDINKDLKTISLSQQLALTMSGLIWTRFSFVIYPVNVNLAIVNGVLAITSGYHVIRKIKAEYLKH